MNSIMTFVQRSSEITAHALAVLRDSPLELSSRKSMSTRAARDAVERHIGLGLKRILGDWCSEYELSRSRRSMFDISINDARGFHYYIDIKTHRLEKEKSGFNMPNITSVRRFMKYY